MFVRFVDVVVWSKVGWKTMEKLDDGRRFSWCLAKRYVERCCLVTRSRFFKNIFKEIDIHG